MFVCMYVCMHVRMYVCMYACMDVRMYVYTIISHAVAVWCTSTVRIRELIRENLCYVLRVHVLSCCDVLLCVAICCSVLQCVVAIYSQYYLLPIHALCDTQKLKNAGYLLGTCMISQARMFLKLCYHAVVAICTCPRSLYACVCVCVCACMKDNK